MSTPVVVAPLLLVLVLAVSAAFKLRSPSTTADAFASLRLPAWMRQLKGPLLLPYGELVLAAALLLVPSPVYVLVTNLTAVLFIAYFVVIARALRFEVPVTCGCFGRLGLGLVDRGTLVRNGILVVLSLVAVGDAIAGHSVIGRFTDFGAEQWGWMIGLLVAILLTGIIVRGGGRQTTQPAGAQTTTNPVAASPSNDADDTDDLEYVREPVPFGVLRNREDGELVPIGQLSGGKPVLLTFLSLGCGSCVRTMEALPAWADRHTLIRCIAIPAGEGQSELPDLGAHVTWMEDPKGQLALAFQAGFPTAVLLGADGLIAGGPVRGFDEIANFFEDITAELADAGIAPNGEPLDSPAANIGSAQQGEPQDGPEGTVHGELAQPVRR